MGSILGTGGGTLQRANLDGTGVERIVEPGITQTPKQMALDLEDQHIYWSDREGAKVWRHHGGHDRPPPGPVTTPQESCASIRAF